MKQYYGVCGRNAAGIFDDWYKVCDAKERFTSIKYKKEYCKKWALDYIIKILTLDYKVPGAYQINKEFLLKNINTVYSIEELIAPRKNQGIIKPSIVISKIPFGVHNNH